MSWKSLSRGRSQARVPSRDARRCRSLDFSAWETALADKAASVADKRRAPRFLFVRRPCVGHEVTRPCRHELYLIGTAVRYTHAVPIRGPSRQCRLHWLSPTICSVTTSETHRIVGQTEMRAPIGWCGAATQQTIARGSSPHG